MALRSQIGVQEGSLAVGLVVDRVAGGLSGRHGAGVEGGHVEGCKLLEAVGAEIGAVVGGGEGVQGEDGRVGVVGEGGVVEDVLGRKEEIFVLEPRVRSRGGWCRRREHFC